MNWCARSAISPRCSASPAGDAASGADDGGDGTGCCACTSARPAIASHAADAPARVRPAIQRRVMTVALPKSSTIQRSLYSRAVAQTARHRWDVVGVGASAVDRVYVLPDSLAGAPRDVKLAHPAAPDLVRRTGRDDARHVPAARHDDRLRRHDRIGRRRRAPARRARARSGRSRPRRRPRRAPRVCRHPHRRSHRRAHGAVGSR